MGKLLSILAALAVLALCAVTGSCNSAGCSDNSTAIPLAGFYSSASAEAISLDSVAFIGLGAAVTDSSLTAAGTPVSQVYLPMNALADNTTWKIEYLNFALHTPELYDTIALSYERIPYFASEECGAMYAYRLRALTHTTHFIDSITVVDSLFTNADRETMKIYFRIAGEGAEE